MNDTIDYPADYPALFRSADRESTRAQRSYLRSFKTRVVALLVAALGGAVTVKVGDGYELGGATAFLAFAVALGAELFLATTHP